MLCRLLALPFLFFPALAAAAPVPQPSAGEEVVSEGAFELLPGVVVDRSRPTVFLQRPDHGIDAVDPSSGALLWSSHEAAKPLLVYGDLLVAQTEPTRAGILGIAFLRRNDGTLQLAMDIALPKDVVGRIADGPGTRFDVWAAVRQGRISIGWESVQHWAKPIPPGPGDAIETRLAGGALIDLQAKVAIPITAPPPRPALPRPWLATDDGSTGEKIRAGGAFVTTRAVRDAGSPRLFLQRWGAETGAPFEEVTLYAGDYHLRLSSADGQHLMVVTNPPEVDGYTFLIFSLANGKLLGKLESQRSHVFFYVLGSVFVSESPPFAQRTDKADEMAFEPRKLRAVDLTTGAVLWERSIRDTAYRGPYPP